MGGNGVSFAYCADWLNGVGVGAQVEINVTLPVWNAEGGPVSRDEMERADPRGRD